MMLPSHDFAHDFNPRFSIPSSLRRAARTHLRPDPPGSWHTLLELDGVPRIFRLAMGHLGSGSWRGICPRHWLPCYLRHRLHDRAASRRVASTRVESSRVESLLEQYSAHAYPRSPAADSAKKVSDVVAQPQVMVRAPNPGCKDLLRVAKVFIISCTAAGGSAQRVHSVPAVGDFRHDTALRCAALRCTALSEILRYDFVPSHCVSKPLGDLPVSQPLCPALHCIILHWIILHYIPLNCIALNCIALNCIALNCIALNCIALNCIALNCIALNCIALNCIKLHCIKLHCITIYSLI